MKLDRLIKVGLNETYSEEHIAKHLSDIFPKQNGLQQRDAFSSLLFNFTLKYDIRMIQDYQVGARLNETHQLLIYANDADL
jgi:hypothetical protein